MYNPKPHQVSDEAAIRSFVAEVGTGTLVVVDSGGRIEASFLPIIWDGDTVYAHCARMNPQVAAISEACATNAGATALCVVQGLDAYVSPSWYASKREHGRVVPTWNYSLAHLRGKVKVHEDPAWLHSVVSRLTDTQENGRADPWQVADAPEEFVAQQLRAIVGLEMTVESFEAKAKWSQNRSAADIVGVVDGLRAEASAASQVAADHMAVVNG